MDLAIVILLIAIVIFFMRDVKWVVYLIGILELFLRLMNFFANNIGLRDVANLIHKYIPSSLFNVLDKYTNGIIYTILAWCLFVILFIWFIYLVRYLIRRK